MPKVKEKRITPDIVGERLGISAQKVRELMDNGQLNIGIVSSTSNGQKQYIILPKPLYEATGLKMNGYEPPTEAAFEFDYAKMAEELAKAYLIVR